MAYSRNPTWKDYPDTSTPITAAHLENIENGLVAAAQTADSAISKATDAANSAQNAATAASQLPDTTVANNINTAGTQTQGALDGRYSPLSGSPKSLAAFGVLPGNTASQNYTAFQNAAASGFTDFVLPAGTYQYAAPAEGNWAMTFQNKSKIRIRGISAVINDTTTFTNQGAFTGLFLFDGCTDVEVSGLEYIGPVLSSPTTLLGYQGAMVVRAINGTKNVKIDMRVSNARYGVQTGDYADATKGLCQNLDVKIRGTKIGYSLAAYYADGIRHDLDVDGIHRIAYIAGCTDVRGVAKWRDQYIADTAYLLTDVLTSGTDSAAQADPINSPTTSRGCSNVDIVSIDKGSTVFQASSMCVGFNVSRVDPFTHSNIRVSFYTQSTNTVSTQVGGFRISSDAKTIWSRYTYNWSSSILFRNIRVTGVADHSAQTLAGNTAGDIYIVMFDTDNTHAGSLSNFEIDGMIVNKSSGGTRACWFQAPNLQDQASIRNFIGPIQDWTILTNSTSTLRFRDCKLGQIDSGSSPVSLTGSSASSITSTSTGVTMNDATVAGAGMVTRQKSTSLTLSGATTTWTAAIPSGAMVLAVQGYVSTAITGATGYEVGVASDVARFVNTNTITQGGTFGIANYASTETAPRYYPSATDLVVTAKTSNFTGGVLHLVVTYATFPALTS